MTNFIRQCNLLLLMDFYQQEMLVRETAVNQQKIVYQMKKQILLALLLSVSSSLVAQVVPINLPANVPVIPTDQTSFINSAIGYFSAFNTNLLWLDRGEVVTGVDSIQNSSVNLANSLRVSYDIWKVVSAEVGIRNSGIAGTIVDYKGGIGLNFKVVDTKLTLYGDGGYSRVDRRALGEFGIRVSKKLTSHTFAGIGLGVIVPQNAQVFQAFAGVSW